jgi:inosose dehydratase
VAWTVLVGQAAAGQGGTTMAIRVGNSPCSWGVDYADDPTNIAWSRCMDQVRESGADCIDLGPVGYLPEDAAVLSGELARRGLVLTAGHLFEPFHDPAQHEAIKRQAHRVCGVLAGQGVSRLVVIDHITPERGRTAGAAQRASRLGHAEWADMMRGFREVAAIAQGEYGVTACLHPHAACFVEFRDEIDRAMQDLPASLVKLCIHTGHSAYAGIDPAELLRGYNDRVVHLHFKDVDPAVRSRVVEEGVEFDAAVSRGVFCPVGKGMVDFTDFRAAMRDTAYAGWGSIEQDIDPGKGQDPLVYATESLRYLRAVGIAR